MTPARHSVTAERRHSAVRDAGRDPRPFCNLVLYDRLPGRHADGNLGGKRMAEALTATPPPHWAAGMFLRPGSLGRRFWCHCGADYKDSCRSANRPVHRPRWGSAPFHGVSDRDPFAHPATWAPFVLVDEGQASARASTTATKPKVLPPAAKTPIQPDWRSELLARW